MLCTLDTRKFLVQLKFPLREFQYSSTLVVIEIPLSLQAPQTKLHKELAEVGKGDSSQREHIGTRLFMFESSELRTKADDSSLWVSVLLEMSDAPIQYFISHQAN